MKQVIHHITTKLLDTCKQRMKYTNERVAEIWVNVLLHCGQFKEAIELLRSMLSSSNGTSPSIPFSLKLWTIRIELTVKHKYALEPQSEKENSESSVVDTSLMQLYNECLDQCMKSKSLNKNTDIKHIWTHFFNYYFDLVSISKLSRQEIFNNFLPTYKVLTSLIVHVLTELLEGS